MLACFNDKVVLPDEADAGDAITAGKAIKKAVSNCIKKKDKTFTSIDGDNNTDRANAAKNMMSCYDDAVYKAS